MASHVQAPPGLDGIERTTDRGRSGWLTFAAVMFMAAAAVNALYGISALVNDDYFRVDELLFGDLSLWGVLYLCVGATQLAAGILVLRRSVTGAVLGIGLALISGLVALFSIGAYPVWSVVVLTIDGLIIYALTVHGLGEA
jgi:hypothetical protein